MSLLLEALKKAERAKQEAQRRARAEPGGEPEELHGQAAASAPGAAAAPVTTRDQLPEISPKLEIVSDDLLDRPAPAPESAPPPREPQPGPALAAAEARASEEAGRASARKVFEAKFREPNPRMPFYVTMGVLGAFGLGTVIYFYLQLRSPAALVNTNPPRQAEQVAVVPPPAPVPPPASSQGAIPGLPSNLQAPSATPVTPAPPAAPVTTAPVATPAPKPAPAAVEPAAKPPAPKLAQRIAPAAPAARTEAAVTRNAAAVHPKVDSAYTAYRAGNLAAAREDYQQALAEEPGNRDALLGLAAVEVRNGRLEAGEAFYMRLLQADPRDAQAQAALIALRGARMDPLAAESRLKSLLAAEPSAHALNFALGSQLAQQGRWAEAQAEFFKAFTAEPDNADFAYNLAVSLDHLRQPKVALEYYQRAITLAKTRGAGFDLAAAQARAAQLTR